MGVSNIKHNREQIQLKEIQLQDRSADLKQLQIDYEQLNQKLDTTDKSKTEEINRLQEEKNKLEQERQRLESELQAKLKRQADERIALQNAANRASGTATASAAPKPVVGSVGNCGDNVYKQFIYQKESGCRTHIYNSIGCYGIGQACPGSKVAHCGADFACQDAWFSNYAIQRYGSWQAAYNFWVKNNWW